MPIPCYEWDRIGHQDVWTKMVYLQAKIDRRTGGVVGVPLAASAGLATGAADSGGGSAAAN